MNPWQKHSYFLNNLSFRSFALYFSGNRRKDDGCSGYLLVNNCHFSSQTSVKTSLLIKIKLYLNYVSRITARFVYTRYWNNVKVQSYTEFIRFWFILFLELFMTIYNFPKNNFIKHCSNKTLYILAHQCGWYLWCTQRKISLLH